MDMNKVRNVMPLIRAMSMYGSSDKDKFECSYPEWQGQRPDTTFYADFSVADVYGVKAIEDTYLRSFGGWKSNVKMLTELVCVMNHKLWFWHEENVEEYARLYDRLWKESDAYLKDTFTNKDDVAYWFGVLD